VAANEREVRAFLRDVIEEHHGDHAGRYLTRDMQWHGATVGTVKGRKDVAGLFAGVVASLPSAHASIKDIFGQGDQVVVRVVVRGTQKGALLGIPATGRNIHWDGVDIYRLQGGKISAIWAGDDWTAIPFLHRHLQGALDPLIRLRRRPVPCSLITSRVTRDSQSPEPECASRSWCQALDGRVSIQLTISRRSAKSHRPSCLMN
jgi:predicted ester cyclase